MAQNLILGLISAQIWVAKFFLKKNDFIKHYISRSAIIMYNIRKTNDSIFRKFSDGETDRQIVISKDTVQLMLSIQHCYTKNISRK